MARKRQIAPEFFSDEIISLLSIEAAYLYIGLWCYADDAGNIEASPAQWRLWVFPGRETVTVEQVRQWQRELETTSRITAYCAAGKGYYHIPSLRRHQAIQHPSKPRCPPYEDSVSSQVDSGGLRRTHLSRVGRESKATSPPLIPPPSGGGSGGRQAGYVKGDGVRGDAGSSTPSLQSTPSDAVPRPTPPLPPPDAGSGAVDPALGDAVRAYETATRRPISPVAAARLGELCDEHGPANVARAIERVAQRGDAARMRSPAYLLPVLREMADGETYSPRGRAVDAPYNIR